MRIKEESFSTSERFNLLHHQPWMLIESPVEWLQGKLALLSALLEKILRVQSGSMHMLHNSIHIECPMRPSKLPNNLGDMVREQLGFFLVI